eukprot:15342630-Ditylum_brightwellii.AAC.1
MTQGVTSRTRKWLLPCLQTLLHVYPHHYHQRPQHLHLYLCALATGLSEPDSNHARTLAKRNLHSELEVQLEKDRNLDDTSKIVGGLLAEV